MARLINSTVVTALAAGMVGGLLAPLVWPAAARAARPAAKRMMRASLAAFERSRELAGVWSGSASDLVAEVEAERAHELRAKTASTGPEPARDPLVRIDGDHRANGERKAHA
jgi:hypothetical protein